MGSDCLISKVLEGRSPIVRVSRCGTANILYKPIDSAYKSGRPATPEQGRRMGMGRLRCPPLMTQRTDR